KIGTATSPVWQFSVGARGTAGDKSDTSWGTTLDLNGDGFADLAVGAFGANTERGAVFIYAGGPGGPSPNPVVTLHGMNGFQGDFGEMVASAGDVNGDGFGDLLVAACNCSDPSVGTGAYVFLGGPSGVSTTPLPLQPPAGTTRFGARVA